MLKYKFNLQIKLDCPVIKANRLTAWEKQILTAFVNQTKS